MSEIHQKQDGDSPIDQELIYTHTKYSLEDRVITVMYGDKGTGKEPHVLFRGSEAGSYVHPKTGQQIDFQYGFFIEADTLTEAFNVYDGVNQEKLEKHIETINSQVEDELKKARDAQARIQTDPRWGKMVEGLPTPGFEGKKGR